METLPMIRSIFFAFTALCAVACSSKQDLGGDSGQSTAGESCASSNDCASGLRCVMQTCQDGKAVGDDGAVDASPKCSSDGECARAGSSARYCKAASVCTECLVDADCSAKARTPRCNVTASSAEQNSCVVCLEDGDCLEGQHCSVVVVGPGRLPPPSVAGGGGNACVACLVDADCTDLSRPRCDATFNSCVACKVSTDCKDPVFPVCSQTLCVAR